MNTWSDGYVSDFTYTTGFYREISPGWLTLSARLLGQRSPSIAEPFDWCELGCGQGFSSLIFAATHPHGRFHAFDFNPAHIDNARSLARRAGIGNVRFEEASFEELANAAPDAHPMMDFIVLHGIWSWVSATQRAHLLRFIRDRLKPGGIVYVSYNTLSGWASWVPVQRLMRLWMELNGSSSDPGLGDLMGFLKELAAQDSQYFALNPMVAARIETISGMDHHYLRHEYLNGTWEPTTFDAVARDMSDAKSSFLGSASLTDNIDAVAVPPKMAAMVAGMRDPRMREALRDLAAGRSFRRDIFRRGIDLPPIGEQIGFIDALEMTGLGREGETNIQIATGIGNVAPKPDIYDPVLKRLAEGPMSFGDLRRMPHMASASLADSLQVVAFLATGGMAHLSGHLPRTKAACAPGRALNAVIAAQNIAGANLPFVVAPLLGTALQIDPMETMLLPQYVDGSVPDPGGVIETLLSMLTQSGRSPMKEGRLIEDPAEARAVLAGTVEKFVTERLPLLRRLGAVD